LSVISVQKRPGVSRAFLCSEPHCRKGNKI
jgi:hypothetical protein